MEGMQGPGVESGNLSLDARLAVGKTNIRKKPEAKVATRPDLVGIVPILTQKFRKAQMYWFLLVWPRKCLLNHKNVKIIIKNKYLNSFKKL